VFVVFTVKVISFLPKKSARARVAAPEVLFAPEV
jgi:hypothetical protein